MKRPRAFACVRTVPWWAWPVVVVALETLILLFVVPTDWAQASSGDGFGYQTYAENLLHHGAFSLATHAPYYGGITRPPGYPAFLMVLDAVGSSHAWLIQIVQLGLVALTAVLVGLIAREFVTPRTALLASLLSACYLPLLAYATHFVTEVPSTFLVTAEIWLALRLRRSPRVRDFATLGVVLAAAAYVRPELLLLAVPIGLGLLLDGRSPWSLTTRAIAIGLTGVLVVILIVPWMIRDSALSGGELVPLSANSGSDLLTSADQYAGLMSDAPTEPEFVWQGRQIMEILRAADLAVDITNADARVQYASNRALTRAAKKILDGVSTGRKVKALPARIRHLWWTADEAAPPGIGGAWAHLCDVQLIVLVLAGLVGVAARGRRFLADWPLWALAVVITILHLYFSVAARYTLQARPMLMVYSAVGIAWAASAIWRRLPRRPASVPA